MQLLVILELGRLYGFGGYGAIGWLMIVWIGWCRYSAQVFILAFSELPVPLLTSLSSLLASPSYLI